MEPMAVRAVIHLHSLALKGNQEHPHPLEGKHHQVVYQVSNRWDLGRFATLLLGQDHGFKSCFHDELRLLLVDQPLN